MNRYLDKLKTSPRAVIVAGLTLLTVAIYAQTAWHPFVSFDDPILIYENPQVAAGLSGENVGWAFTSTRGASFWHPLTWLSIMADVEMFGMEAGGHHAVSAILHLLGSIALFFALLRMTGSGWKSGFVAALFAVHPMHVESVAWAAERKDVLSGLFFFLALWAYARYAERPVLGRYLAVVAFFGMSLMSKPMGVTFPFVLLLLDWWPLCRIQGLESDPAVGSPHFPARPIRSILMEKIPLVLMAVLSAAVTLGYPQDDKWLGTLDKFPMWVRLANAFISYATYLWKTAWPAALSVFYRHPGRDIDAGMAIAAFILLIGITLLAFRLRKRWPCLLSGWLFYMGTLVPVIGLVQVSEQAMADRFTYVPLTGVFVMIAWGIPELARRIRIPGSVLVALGLASLMALSAVAWRQAGYWRSSDALFSHAIDLDPDNWLAHSNLGIVRAEENRYDEAISHYRAALRVWPDYADAHYNLGSDLLTLGRSEEAIPHFLEVLRLTPGDRDARIKLDDALAARYRPNPGG